MWRRWRRHTWRRLRRLEKNNVFLTGGGDIYPCIFEIENLVRNQNKNGCILTHFDQSKDFCKMKLSTEALRILTTPNAGVNSIQSEVLSFEFFKKYCNAHLLKTEMEVEYWPCGGSINDYVMYVFDMVIGVSVTRAMKFPITDMFTVEDAQLLLSKKLNGINRSSRNTLIKWAKQILHVWAWCRLDIKYCFTDYCRYEFYWNIFKFEKLNK